MTQQLVVLWGSVWELLCCDFTTQQFVALWVKTIFPHRIPWHNNLLCCDNDVSGYELLRCELLCRKIGTNRPPSITHTYNELVTSVLMCR